MLISTIQLPKNENPKEEELKDEDTNILAAFRTIFDGYRRAQCRTRAIIKAYNDLESIALNLLNERRESSDVSPKQNKEKASSNSTVDTELTDVLMVDLTSDFDFAESVPLVKNVRSRSPIFGTPEKSSKTKKSFEERILSKVGETSKSSKLEVTKNHYGIKIENKISEDNEENSALVGNKNDKTVAITNDVESHSSLNESRICGKLSLSRGSYKIEKHKAPGGKTSKQSTLIFQPQLAKVDISCSEKMKSKSASHWANLFDEDYRVKKNSSSNDLTATEDKNGQLKNVVKEKMDRPVKCVSKFIDKPAIQSERNPEKTLDESTVMESSSQINDTARSLFDDEEFDDFQITQNALNTCMDASVAVAVRSMSPNNFGKRRKIDIPNASTPRITETCHEHDSIDETFFAPGELHAVKNVVAKSMNKKSPVAGCSKILTPKKAADKFRGFKKKIDDKPAKNHEIDDFDLTDAEWDIDISNEILSPVRRPLDNSFDIVPEKPKKSPEYAYKSKAERNKDKKSKLPGWDCWECEKYYGTMNLPPAELKKRMASCSRHKFKYNQRYYTPKDFWNPDFPDTLDSSDCSDNDRSINEG